MATLRTATKGILPVMLFAGTGCLWRPKPYAADPLVRGHRATLANPAAAPIGPEPDPTPAPPLPPNDPAAGK
ncbi:MAG TPA: hypothetical protein VGJ05_14875 [Fimbriiglobus sp.]|jgi:hypothetical protein